MFLLALWFASSCASARYTMDLSTRVEYASRDAAWLNFTLVNLGDEIAYNVRLEPVLPAGMESNNLYVNGLPPGYVLNGSLSVNASPGMLDGTYPLVLVLRYSDRNAYPLSVVYPQSFTLGRSSSSMVAVSIPDVSLTGKEPVDYDVGVVNRDSKKHNVTIRVYLPDELDVSVEEKTVEMEALSAGRLKNTLWSAGALYDSDYAALASVSYVEDGVMHSSLASGRVRVVKPPEIRVEDSFFKRNQDALIHFIYVSLAVVFYVSAAEKGGVSAEGEKKRVRRRR